MRRFHLVYGWVLFATFLLTGQYMHRYLYHLMYLPDGTRMLYRSRHIYILMASLLNVGIGVYFIYAAQRWRRRLQLAGSTLMIAAPVLLIVAFFKEAGLGPDKTVFSFFGIIAMAVGLLLHFIGGVRAQASGERGPSG